MATRAATTKGGYRDTIIGAVVILVAALLLGTIYSADGGAAGDGYRLVAKFNRADGIVVGTDVRLAGIQVGDVVGQSLDERFRAVIELNIAKNVALTADTAAIIRTDGLLGSKFIDLQPGADDEVLRPGGEIAFTQDSMVIEELLDMIIQQARVRRGFQDQSLPNGN